MAYGLLESLFGHAYEWLTMRGQEVSEIAFGEHVEIAFHVRPHSFRPRAADDRRAESHGVERCFAQHRAAVEARPILVGVAWDQNPTVVPENQRGFGVV